MNGYLDTSALVAVYVSEAHSALARREALSVGQVPFTPLHDLELWNALRLLKGRRLISDYQFEQLSSHVVADRDAGRLVDAPVDLHHVFARASDLSAMYAPRFLWRSLDILHVAAALELRCRRFVSGDDRQLALAQAVGIAVVDIKGRRRRKPR